VAGPGSAWPRRSTPRWRAHTLLGLLEPALSYVLLNLGLAQTSAVHEALLEALYVFFVVLQSRSTARRALALRGALVGLEGRSALGSSVGPGRQRTRPCELLRNLPPGLFPADTAARLP
jgi:hypothetical protein